MCIRDRWEDVDLTGGKKWYSKARAWAKNQGISDGSRPNAAITRAEMCIRDRVYRTCTETLYFNMKQWCLTQ